MQASQFIDLLEKHGLLSPDIIEELRKQVAASRVRMTPESIAKLLVDNGQLTRFQATKLISENQVAEVEPPPPPSTRGNQDDLSIQDEEDAEVLEVIEEDTSGMAIIIDDDDEAVDVEEVYEEEVIEEPVKRASSSSAPKMPSGPVKPVTVKTKSNANPWDSFGIIGVGTIFLLLLIPLVVLGTWLMRGSAEDAMKKADSFYDTRDYAEAIKHYGRFVEKFSSDEKVSFAKVRVGLSRIRNESEKVADPLRALATEKEVLPELEKEKALSSERSDLAGAMLTIAEKFASKADSSKKNDEKKALIKGMDEHLILCQNPLYIDTTARKQSEQRIAMINENRAKVVKDIERADDLVAAVDKMKAALEKEDVTAAYTVRKELLKKHVQLESDQQLTELLATGTEKQAKQVGNTKDSFRPVEPPANAARIKTAILANVRQAEGAKPREGTEIVRIKSAVYALSRSDGKPKWRSNIGTELEGDVKPVSADPAADVVLTLPAPGILQRLNAENGETVWKVGIGKRILDPVIDREDLFVTTVDGGVYCLDLGTGTTKWSRQIPQPCDTGVCVVPGKNVVYLTGNHSNFYVFARKDGSCSEVYYTGHLPGAVRVPPIVLSGHIFVFDNAGANYSNIQILKFGDDGTQVRQAQLPMRLDKGHVVVSPQSQGRRIAVVTDLGEIAVLDVETSRVNQDQVSRIIGQVGTEAQPKRAWPLMEKTDLWIAGNSIARYEMLVSKQKLTAEWVKEDQDTFTARPRYLGDSTDGGEQASSILHTRTLRGNKGVRVVAADSKTGNVQWEVDLGVPVTFMQLSDTVFPIQAVTSQGSLYQVGKEPFAANGFATSKENVGRNERSLMFRNPVRMKDGRVVMLNESQPSQLFLFDPKGTKENSRRITLALDGDVSAAPVGVKNLLALPLNNGQIVVVDPMTGQRKMAPFQPTLQPGARPSWVGPTVLSDQQTLIIANDSQTLFRIAVGNDMRSLAEKQMERGLRGRLVTLGETILGIGKGNATESIEVINAGSLAPMGSIALQGQVAWGPYVVDKIAVVQSGVDGIVAVDESGAKVWSKAIPNGTLIGEPAFQDGKIYASLSSGTVLQIDAASGEILGEASVGEPISSGPVILKTAVVVPGDEGTIFAISIADFKLGGQQ